MCCDELSAHDCSTCNRNQEIVAREGRRAYRLQNPSQKLVCKVTIDGCYISKGKRCDYLIIDCEAEDARFVELEGSDFLRAVDQIAGTIAGLVREIRHCRRVSARIVTSKITAPNVRNVPKVLKLKKLLRARGGDLKYQSQVMQETLF